MRWTAQAARILRERRPRPSPVERDIRIVEHGYRNQDARVSVGAHTLARKHLLAELSRLQAADWERAAHTADGGLLTLAAWAGALADEDDAHLPPSRPCCCWPRNATGRCSACPPPWC